MEKKMLNAPGMPEKLKSAETAFQKGEIPLNHLIRYCADWSADNSTYFKFQTEPLKNEAIEDYDNLSDKEKVSPPLGYDEYKRKAREVWLQNYSNLYWLREYYKISQRPELLERIREYA